MGVLDSIRNLAHDVRVAAAAAGWSEPFQSAPPAYYPNPGPVPPAPLETPIGPVTPADPAVDPKELSAAALQHTYHPFPVQPLPEEWTIDLIRSARQQHDLGQFRDSVRLRDAITTDPRVTGSLSQRVAAASTLPWKVCPSDYQNGRGMVETARGEIEEWIADRSTIFPPSEARGVIEDLAMYGVAILQNHWSPRADGSRWDITKIERWPMQYAWWHATLGTYQVTAAEGLVTVRHGDGKWIVLTPYGLRSWMNGAVRCLSIPWADRTYAIRFRAQYAAVHGSPAPIGTLPSNIQLKSAQGQQFLRLIKMLRDGRAAGVKPLGSTIEYLEAQATAGGAVFRQIVDCSDADIAYALHGLDGTQENAVYKPPTLQGVRYDLVELDARTLDVALTQGAAMPWTVINFGDPRVCPRFERTIPDLEKEQRDKANAAQVDAFTRGLAELETAGIQVTQDVIDAMQALYLGGMALPQLIKSPKPVAVQPPAAIPESSQKKERVAA
ncbi:MAG TPA: DUF935 family protein [Gaiellaceae bacterium]|jgi:hypothetical protein|nr:DUF935 family protein [Gaiellaceae bacterium]